MVIPHQIFTQDVPLITKETMMVVYTCTPKCIAATLQPLSMALQEKGLDLIAALVKDDQVVLILSEDRENANEKLRVPYYEVTNMAGMLGFQANMPRVVSSSCYFPSEDSALHSSTLTVGLLDTPTKIKSN